MMSNSPKIKEIQITQKILKTKWKLLNVPR